MTDKEMKEKIMDEMMVDLGIEIEQDRCPYWAIELVDALIRKGWRKQNV